MIGFSSPPYPPRRPASTPETIPNEMKVPGSEAVVAGRVVVDAQINKDKASHSPNLAAMPQAQLDRLLREHLHAEAGEIVASLDAIKNSFEGIMYAMPSILVASRIDAKTATQEYREMQRQAGGRKAVMDDFLGLFGITRPQRTAMLRTNAVPLPEPPGDSLGLRYMVGIVDNGDGGERAQLYERSPESLNGNDFFYTAIDPYQLSSIEKIEEIKNVLLLYEQKRVYAEAGSKLGNLFAQSMRAHLGNL